MGGDGKRWYIYVPSWTLLACKGGEGSRERGLCGRVGEWGWPVWPASVRSFFEHIFERVVDGFLEAFWMPLGNHFRACEHQN